MTTHGVITKNGKFIFMQHHTAIVDYWFGDALLDAWDKYGPALDREYLLKEASVGFEDCESTAVGSDFDIREDGIYVNCYNTRLWCRLERGKLELIAAWRSDKNPKRKCYEGLSIVEGAGSFTKANKSAWDIMRGDT